MEIKRVWGNDENNNEEEGIGRGYKIFEALINRNIRPHNILDLCCGKGYVLFGLSKKFPNTICQGVDIWTYDEWTKYNNIKFYHTTFQDFINTYNNNFDLTLMLETWRRWDMLPDENLVWRKNLICWLKEHTRYFICSDALFELESCSNEIIGIDTLKSKGNHTLYLVNLCI